MLMFQAKKYIEQTSEMKRALEARDQCRKDHDTARKERETKFRSGFQAISLRLKQVYQAITLGGTAELELVDSADPFSEGVVFRYFFGDSRC